MVVRHHLMAGIELGLCAEQQLFLTTEQSLSLNSIFNINHSVCTPISTCNLHTQTGMYVYMDSLDLLPSSLWFPFCLSLFLTPPIVHCLPCQCSMSCTFVVMPEEKVFIKSQFFIFSSSPTYSLRKLFSFLCIFICYEQSI